MQQRPCSYSSSPSENQLSPSIYTKGCPQKNVGSPHLCIILTYYRSTCGRCLECSHNYLQCKQLASHLPPTHKRVFDYLTGWLFFKISITSYNSSAFLREVLSHSAKNGIDPKILATLFCNLFLRVTLSLFDLLPT